MSLDAAARSLGISGDAVRKRIERGALDGEKRGGKWFVRLSASERRPEPSGASPDSSGSAPLIAALSSEVDHLRGELAWTREELAARSRELAAERERFDVIHRTALLRIESLLDAALPERLGAPETRETPPAPVASPAAPDRGAETAQSRAPRPWWRFW